ncbi:hypothetical protein BGZ83_005524, partial [Gryganskiella cystojenkinii]
LRRSTIARKDKTPFHTRSVIQEHAQPLWRKCKPLVSLSKTCAFSPASALALERFAALHSLPRAIWMPRLYTSATVLALIPNHWNNAKISALFKPVVLSARQHQTSASALSAALES